MTEEIILIILTTFVTGFIAFKSKFPPLVGFLIAGFALHAFGVESNEIIQWLADTGVTLLLFTIGLKLDIKMLIGKHIWLSALIHNLGTTLYFFLALWGLQIMGISLLASLGYVELLLVAFALSFSSTVFAIKTLQEKGVMNAIYGALSIGVLVMQDIFAVVFMTISTGKVPEIWAFLLFGLPLLRPLFYKVMDIVEHGEMLVIFGIFMCFVMGSGLFAEAGLKPDLGALIIGVLLSGHPKASELSKSLFNIKELLLVCFFLDIGLSTSLSTSAIIFAFVLVLLLPLKGWLYFRIFDLFNFRVRTSVFSALTLMNYSEFGLIVGGLGYKFGWISGELLVSIAVAVSLSFIIASPINNWSNEVYQLLAKIKKENSRLNKMDQMLKTGKSKILILGMGRIGTGIYDEINKVYEGQVLGVDVKEGAVESQLEEGRRAILGDAIDWDFWHRIRDINQFEMILFAMPHHHSNDLAFRQLKHLNFRGKTAAIVEYSDQIEQLKSEGMDAVYNVYREAGKGFAQHVIEQFSDNTISIAYKATN
ncbi:cation:proton antiporter family protein [Flammeovirga sp. SJP92]|uniref:cation:proton antiporter family protein n=1 Tax=Flammeovirga sp. SJP92 TaxID=1775430 RepID=UPI0007886804|nr:cation:proton antiporter family protein [Flammeovirga sp. SJP92]KXX68476.1 potassium transporter Kef [Flammeovirga sp. SJP92]